MYIKKIHLENFQSHKDSEIIFVPGINVITGQSDTGKTAIIRALNWLVWNRPSGDEFINKNSDSCSVCLELSDGTKIKREKGKNKNCYYLNGNILKSIGSDVPDEIKNKLNFSEINIQNQFDAPFLISLTPGQIAKLLNEVSHLEDIDESTNKINSFIKDEKNTINILQNQNENLKKQLENFPDVEKLSDELKTIENKKMVLDDCVNKLNRLKKILSDFFSIKMEYEKRKIIFQNIQKLKISCESIYRENILCNDLKMKKQNLFDKISEYKKIHNKLALNKNFYQSIPNIKNNIEIALNTVQTVKNNVLYSSSLSSLIKAYRNEQKNLNLAIEKLAFLKNEWERLKPDVCPLCGGIWNENG